MVEHSRNISDDQFEAEPDVMQARSCRSLISALVVVFIYAYNRRDWFHLSNGMVPEQLHLSLGANDHEYAVTWATMEPADSYLVWCEEPGCKDALCVQGSRATRTLELRGQKRVKFTYRARMAVAPGKLYTYKVFACYHWSDTSSSQCDATTMMKHHFDSSRNYTFKAKTLDDHEAPISAIVYADMGVKSAQTGELVSHEIDQHDFIIHNGNFASDSNSQLSNSGDEFMRLMEPIAAKIPYQTSAGRHELVDNFSDYNHRFTMINRALINGGILNNFFYSFNAGPVHLVAISTEFYSSTNCAILAQLVSQYDWLTRDLEFAASPTERAKRPWIVVFGYSPMYWSKRHLYQRRPANNLLRLGLPSSGTYALERLFYEFGVDVQLYSHGNFYERFLPLYNGTVFDRQRDPYNNPQAPVHLTSGSALCRFKFDDFWGEPAIGSVIQISRCGYLRFKAWRNRLTFERVNVEESGHIVDAFTITKDRQNFPLPSEHRQTGSS